MGKCRFGGAPHASTHGWDGVRGMRQHPGPDADGVNNRLRTVSLDRPHSRMEPRPEKIFTPLRDTTQGRVVLMQIEQATELVRHTLLLALIVSAPMLLIGLCVGIVVSLLQAVTQIQEQTLSFIPKIVSMVAAAIILMPWMGHRLMEYSIAMFGSGQLP